LELVRGHHSVGEANLHLQFTPKYRRDVFRDPEVKRVCEESFRATAEKLGLVIHALSFAPDHVHIFVGACRNHSVAEVVRRLKGASSRQIRRRCWSRIMSKLWGKNLLVNRILLPISRIHHRKSHTILRREEPGKTLESPRLPNIQTQKRTNNHKPIHTTLRASALSSLVMKLYTCHIILSRS